MIRLPADLHTNTPSNVKRPPNKVSSDASSAPPPFRQEVITLSGDRINAGHVSDFGCCFTRRPDLDKHVSVSQTSVRRHRRLTDKLTLITGPINDGPTGDPSGCPHQTDLDLQGGRGARHGHSDRDQLWVHLIDSSGKQTAS